MKSSLFMLSIFLLPLMPLFGQAGQNDLSLMPMPANVMFGEGAFRIGEDFAVAVHGPDGDRVYKGATRMLRRLTGRTGLFLPQHFMSAADNADTAYLQIRWRRREELAIGMNESYTLNVTPNGITLTALTDIGVLRGLETLLGLLTTDNEGYYFPAVNIEDQPRFKWRGLMIDASRHFMPVNMVKRNLDAMAAVKLNTMHWHLSEDQGFRVESKVYPKLHELGSDGMYYTQDQIRDIITYADDRGIRVMPEFDIPGHATAWLVGYPVLATLPSSYSVERNWGIMDPVMDPTKETTYQFLDRFIGEMMQLFPDEYFHIGGDENNGVHWDASEAVQAFKAEHNLEDNHAVQGWFNNRILEMLTRYNRKMVGWDEIFHPSMPTNIVIHSWRGREVLAEAARQGYQSILSNGYYIDLIQTTEYHYLNDPIPPGSNLPAEAAARILGGEATMWSEFVNWETVDSRIWPRTAAIAERFWSPQDVRDVDDMYRRLDVVSLQLEEHGLTHEKNYAMMLRRLVVGRDIDALKTFVDVVEPVKIYRRNQLRPHTSTSPLTRVIDAARPDQTVARNFRRLVAAYLEDVQAHPRKRGRLDKGRATPQALEIARWLTLWQANHNRLKPRIDRSPALQEIESLSADLAALSAIGYEAVRLLEAGKRPKAGWVVASLQKVEAAKQPRGQVELMILPAIKALVQAAGS